MTRIKGARMEPIARKEQILATAIKISIETGYQQLTRNAVAHSMQCTAPLISHYYSIEDLRRDVLSTAIEKEIMPILAQSIVTRGHEIPAELKQKVIQYLNT